MMEMLGRCKDIPMRLGREKKRNVVTYGIAPEGD
jgi:hypothetical protein